MAFHPDILVTTSAEPRVALVVEARVHLQDLERTERELKWYMVQIQCPTGLLITPERLWLYRDRYTGRSEQSVERIGEYNAAQLWTQSPPREEVLFEDFVQRWLEQIADPPSREIPHDIDEALREYVLPAVSHGEVRAAGPRGPRPH